LYCHPLDIDVKSDVLPTDKPKGTGNDVFAVL
jgi:hypothetical protein